MNLATNGVVITDVIKFVHTNKEKLMSKKEDDNVRRIEKRSWLGTQPALLHAASIDNSGNICVADIWESEQDLDNLILN